MHVDAGIPLACVAVLCHLSSYGPATSGTRGSRQPSSQPAGDIRLRVGCQWLASHRDEIGQGQGQLREW